MDQRTSLSKTTITLHWLVGLSIISLLGVGWYMSEFEAYSLYPIHKSIGILIILLVIPRVIWRLKQGFPVPAQQPNPLEHLIAKLVHWTLLISTLLFPISGMMMSGGGGYGLSIFGWEVLAANYDPVTKSAVPLSEAAAGLGHEMHGILMWVVLIALVLHIGGALKHHIIDKDGTLSRMFGKQID